GGDLCVTGGSVAGALLMAHQHVAQLLRGEQGVVQGKDGTAGQAEDDVGAELLEGPDDRLGAGHPLGCVLGSRGLLGDRGRGGRLRSCHVIKLLISQGQCNWNATWSLLPWYGEGRPGGCRRHKLPATIERQSPRTALMVGAVEGACRDDWVG